MLIGVQYPKEHWHAWISRQCCAICITLRNSFKAKWKTTSILQFLTEYSWLSQLQLLLSLSLYVFLCFFLICFLCQVIPVMEVSQSQPVSDRRKRISKNITKFHNLAAGFDSHKKYLARARQSLATVFYPPSRIKILCFRVRGFLLGFPNEI